MNSLEDFIREIINKSIHIVGVTGAEGSSILRFLRKHSIANITVHDFLREGPLEKSFKLWHKGVKWEDRDKLFWQFQKDLEGLKFYSQDNYLKKVTEADIIFVPQSWRLYKEINSPLFEAKKKNIPFYSLTRLYLDFAQAQIIGVTGTVGKGSTANLLVKTLEASQKKTFFAGNETWMLQVADKLDEMKKNDILVLEISHRQLLDGFTRAPHIVVFTNLYPNHLDEVSWEEYKNVKFSLLEKQKTQDYAVINYDSLELQREAKRLQSKVLYFSSNNIEVNTKDVQKIYSEIMDKNSVHYLENILAVSTVANILDIASDCVLTCVSNTKPLPARLEYLGRISGIEFYDDIKSTTPWATGAALNKLKNNIILICGGKTKGIDYREFIQNGQKKVKFVFILESELSFKLSNYLSVGSYQIVDSLEKAIKHAFNKASKEDKIVVSPAASFFYTDFIKGKKSIRKLMKELASS